MSNRLRVRPPCFAEVYRRCAQKDLFWKFSDGSIYHYLPISIDEAVAVAKSVKKGFLYNKSFRQDGFSQTNFERVTTIPTDAELIDFYPPYVARNVPPCSGWEYVIVPPASALGTNNTFAGEIHPETEGNGRFNAQSPIFHFDVDTVANLNCVVNWDGQWTPDTAAYFDFFGQVNVQPPESPVYGPVEFHGTVTIPSGDWHIYSYAYDFFFGNKTITVNADWTF